METFSLITDSIMDFILNWTTYFCGIPISLIIWTLFVKKINKIVLVDDIPGIIIGALIHPLLSIVFLCFILASPILAPMVYLILEWDKIKDKKIF